MGIAWSVNLALTVVTVVSSIALSYFLRRDNKKMDEAEINGSIQDDGTVEGKVDSISRHNEHPTAGRPLGGTKAGGFARYQI
jgi:hypothetical protein